jgi:hypothetical protein
MLIGQVFIPVYRILHGPQIVTEFGLLLPYHRVAENRQRHGGEYKKDRASNNQFQKRHSCCRGKARLAIAWIGTKVAPQHRVSF